MPLRPITLEGSMPSRGCRASAELTDAGAESVLLRAFEAGIVGPRALPAAIREWRQDHARERKPDELGARRDRDVRGP